MVHHRRRLEGVEVGDDSRRLGLVRSRSRDQEQRPCEDADDDDDDQKLHKRESLRPPHVSFRPHVLSPLFFASPRCDGRAVRSLSAVWRPASAWPSLTESIQNKDNALSWKSYTLTACQSQAPTSFAVAGRSVERDGRCGGERPVRSHEVRAAAPKGVRSGARGFPKSDLGILRLLV